MEELLDWRAMAHEVGRCRPGMAMCMSPRSEVNWLAGQVDVCYLYAENEGFVSNPGKKLRV